MFRVALSLNSLLAALALVNPWLRPAWAEKSVAKTSCTKKELKRFDCRLHDRGYNIRLLAKTVAWHDSTWHTIDPIPLAGDGTSWEKVTFEFFDGHPILQFWIWDKGVGEASIQSLHWYVADAEKRKFTVLAEGIVRKRHLHEGEAGAVTTKEPKYLYDGWEIHALRSGKGRKLEWQLGSQRKLIDPPVSPKNEAH